MNKPQWQYLEPHLDSWRKQLYIKGQRIKASDIYAELLLNNETPEDAAEKWGFPLAVIQEVIEYCKTNSDLLMAEKKEEYRRSNKIVKKLKILQFIEWFFLVFFTVLLVVLGQNWLRFILVPLILVLFLRVADRIPFLGSKWKWLFGERTLWDWLTLLFVPVALTMLGIYFSALFTASQGDINIEKLRQEVTNDYFKVLQDGAIINKIKKSDLSQLKVFAKNDNRESQHCGNNINSSWLRNQTLLVLDQLTNLKTAKVTKNKNKKHIIEFLHSSELIGKDNKNYLSLRHADMTGSNLVQAHLENSCLESINFADPYSSSQSSSDLRHANLQESDLRGANLAKANLRNANLSNTDLGGWASLYKADLRGANLAGAIINDTVLTSAMYNTKPIDVDNHINNSISNFVCHKLNFIVNTSGLCIDSVDYITLFPTVFPKDYYKGDITFFNDYEKNPILFLKKHKVTCFQEILSSKLSEGALRLDKDKLKKLGFQKKNSLMEENNSLAFFH
jgi:uncharacterized protein YjbI with pentapeptide repeats